MSHECACCGRKCNCPEGELSDGVECSCAATCQLDELKIDRCKSCRESDGCDGGDFCACPCHDDTEDQYPFDVDEEDDE